jgi:hypothetical protein
MNTQLHRFLKFGLLPGLILWQPNPAAAAMFNVAPSDVAELINAIKDANTTPGDDTIRIGGRRL